MANVEIDERRLDAILGPLNQCQRPGAAIGIALDGRSVFRKGVGLAAIDAPIVITPSTKMRIYSVTKHFACLCYLMICGRGRASLDDPIGKYLPEVHPVSNGVTMRQLMSHTSGIVDVKDVHWNLGSMNQIVSSAEVVKRYETLDKLNFSAGSAWCYNNGGYQLLSAAIERILDAPLERIFREWLFEPLGMRDTLVVRQDTGFVPNCATMHMCAPGGEYVRTYLPGELSGDAGCVSTVDDMLRWMEGEDQLPGAPGAWRVMSKPQQLENGASTGYGLGLVSNAYRGIEFYGHAGNGLGATAQMIRVPSLLLDIVVLVNREDVNAWDLGAKILNACVTGLQEKVGRGEGVVTCGKYYSSGSGRLVELDEEDGEQVVAINGRVGAKFRRDDRGVLRPHSELVTNELIRILDGNGTPPGIWFEYWGSAEELAALQTKRHSEGRKVSGTYRSEVFDTEMSVQVDADKGLLEADGPFGSVTHELKLLGNNLWRFKPMLRTLPWGGILEFDEEAHAMYVTTECTRRLQFSR